MTSTKRNVFNRLLIVFFILTIPVLLFAQDTIKVRLPISDFSNDPSVQLDLSRILINRLFKTSDYIIVSAESDTETVDLIGLCEIDIKTIPDGFTRSEAVLISNNVILSTSKNNIESLNELSEKRVGVISSSLAAYRIRQETQFFKIYPTSFTLLLDLISERIDYAVVEASIAKSLLSRQTNQIKLHIVNENIFGSNLGFLIRSNNSKLETYLNARIKSFKNSNESQEVANRFIDLPKDYQKLFLILGIAIGTILILILTYLGWKRGWIKRLANSYKVKMNGLVMIRPLPNTHTSSSEDPNRQSFRDKFSYLQTKYPSIEIRLDLQRTAVKIEFRSVNKTIVDSKEFLDRFAADLEDLLSVFTSEKYILELNITGECSNNFELNKFVFTNNGNKVGVIVTNFKKKFSF